MKALLRRDLKRLARWAWAGPILLLLAMSQSGWRSGVFLDPLSDSVQVAGLFGFPSFGILLGLAALWGERAGGARDTLLHRAVGRRRLALAKWLAAAIPYGIGVALPSAILLVSLAGPNGTSTPFRWAMGWPMLVDGSVGLLGVSAGMLIAQRPRRWIGSRLLPAACVFTLAALAYLSPDLWLALTIAWLPQPFFLHAAIESFASGGADESLPIPARASLGLTLVGGLAGVGALAMVLASSAFVTREGYEVVRPTRQGDLMRTVAESGLPLRTFWQSWTEQGLGPRRELSREERKELGAPLTTLVLHREGGERSRWYRSRDRHATFLSFAEGDERCWYVHDPGWIECRSTQTGALRRRAGLDGLHEDGTEPVPFPGRLVESSLIRARDSWLVTTAMAAPGDSPWGPFVPVLRAEPSQPIEHAGAERAEGGETRCLLVRDGKLELLDRQGRSLLTRPLPLHDGARPDFVQDHLLENGSRVLKSSWRRDGLILSELSAWDRSGHPDASLEIEERSASTRLTRTGNVAAGLLVPPAVRWAWPALSDRLRLKLASSLQAIEGGPARKPASLASALICAVLGLWLSRRRASGRPLATMGWVATAGLLGPAGLVALLGLSRRTVTEPCACGALRAVDRETCPACGAGWPPPPEDARRIVVDAA